MEMLRDFFRSVESFLLPDRVSLKVIFDNVRNSIIASTLVSGGLWVGRFAQSPVAKSAAEAEPFLFLLAGGLVWLGFALVVLNFLQIIVISGQSRTVFAIARPGAPRSLLSGVLTVTATIAVTGLLLLVQGVAIAVFSLAVLRGVVGAP
jgi:hypothetical protein